MSGTVTREKILEAARRALARYGPRKISLGDIVRPLGVTKAALYHHFPGGKHEILEAVLRSEEEGILQAMRDATTGEADPGRRLRQAVLAKLRRLRWLKEVLDVAQNVGLELRALCEREKRRFTELERRFIEEILDEGQRQGIFRPTPRERLARGIQSALRDLESTLVFSDDEREMEAVVDEMMDVLFYGILARPQRREV